MTSSELLSVSPTPPATGTGTGTVASNVPAPSQQLSPHLGGSPHVAGMANGLHALLPFGIPPPPAPAAPPPPPPPPPAGTHNLPVGGAYPHYCGPNCGCGGSASWPASWYELILPPDRYLDHARNVELTIQPEQLICHCKYDNLSLDIWKRFRGAQQTHAKFKLKMRLWRYLFIGINVSVA